MKNAVGVALLFTDFMQLYPVIQGVTLNQTQHLHRTDLCKIFMRYILYVFVYFDCLCGLQRNVVVLLQAKQI